MIYEHLLKKHKQQQQQILTSGQSKSRDCAY